MHVWLVIFKNEAHVENAYKDDNVKSSKTSLIADKQQ